MRSRSRYLQTFPRCQLWFNHQSNRRDNFIHKITFSRGKYVRRILLDEARILSEMNVALPHNLLTLLSLLNNVFNGYTVKKDFFLKRKKTKHFFMPSLVMIRVLTLALVILFLAIFGFLCLFRKMTNNYYACSPCCWLLLKAFPYIYGSKRWSYILHLRYILFIKGKRAKERNVPPIVSKHHSSQVSVNTPEKQ